MVDFGLYFVVFSYFRNEMEAYELYPDFYGNEDDPEDPERLTVIDDPFTMIATGWDDGRGYSTTGMDEEI